jgi:hypothetical protein
MYVPSQDHDIICCGLLCVQWLEVKGGCSIFLTLVELLTIIVYNTFYLQS